MSNEAKVIPMEMDEREEQIREAVQAFPCPKEQIIYGEPSGDDVRWVRFDALDVRDLLSTIDALRARVAELESAPTDAEIEEWMMNARTSKTGCKGPVCVLTASDFDRAVSLMRRAKAAEAQDVGRVDPERVDRDVAVDLLTDALDRAADPGHQGWDFVNLSGEIVDAILRAARGGAT